MMQTKWQDLLKTVTFFKLKTTSTSLPGRISNHCKSITLFKRAFSSNSYQNVKKTKVMKPLMFTIGVGITSFSGCAVVQYERTKQRSVPRSFYETTRYKRVQKEFLFREKIKLWWDSLGDGHKITVGLIGLNLVTFGLWQLRACRPFMSRWFASSPSNRRSSTLLLACFSHSEFWHLLANMFVLWSFAPLIQSIMGSEQFIAFYLTGGCASSFVSHCFKIATYSSIPSLGASGALLAVLAACCIEEPEARLSIILLPFFTFSAKTALFGIITFDVCGILFRWMLFDHACHLGGTLFGSWYILYGHRFTWDKRAPIIRKWHDLRKSFEKS